MIRAIPNLIERAFVAAVSNGNMQDAFALADRQLAHDPNNNLARLALGIKAIKAKHFAAARAYFTKAGAGQQRDITATLLDRLDLCGHRQTRARRSPLSTSFMAKISGFSGIIMPRSSPMSPSNPQEALKRMKAAYAADKNTLRLVDAYARFMARHGDRDEACGPMRPSIKFFPTIPSSQRRSPTSSRANRLNPLVKDAQEGAAEVLYGLGAAGGQQGDELAAMIYLRLALYLTPHNSLAMITLGDLCERIKQNEQAIDVYGMVREDDPLRTTADIQTGQILEALDRPDEAAKYLKRIVDENPKNHGRILGARQSATRA